MGASIINVTYETADIISGIRKALSKKRSLGIAKNPYGNGTAAKQMLSIIKNNINNIFTKKKFYDINVLK
jgi:UDP-N-acetylglucosamine 2-epimerase